MFCETLPSFSVSPDNHSWHSQKYMWVILALCVMDKHLYIYTPVGKNNTHFDHSRLCWCDGTFRLWTTSDLLCKGNKERAVYFKSLFLKKVLVYKNGFICMRAFRFAKSSLSAEGNLCNVMEMLAMCVNLWCFKRMIGQGMDPLLDLQLKWRCGPLSHLINRGFKAYKQRCWESKVRTQTLA